jgi:plasmid stabilization system protein ParE
MSLRVVFRRAARHDFEEAASWYNERRAGLGAEFTSEIDRALSRASDNPQHFPIMYRDTRCVRVRRFPYSVFFRAETSRIVVLAVFHARRDPTIWKQRI